MNGREIWIVIEEAPRYSVSSWGRVRNDKTGRILKPGTIGAGYVGVSLYTIPGISPRSRSVHGLVARAFYTGYKEDFEVNHINGDKRDNFVGNLEWISHPENMIHAQKMGVMKNNGRKKTPVRIIETGEVYESQAACARAIGGRQGHINQCLTGNGRITSHRGYTFEYA